MTNFRISKMQQFLALVSFFVIGWVFLAVFSTTELNDLLINQQIRQIPSNPTHHTSINKLGLLEMKKSTVSIVGVGRNLESKLNAFLRRVGQLGDQFKYSQTVFVVGDSSDNTTALLQKWVDEIKDVRFLFVINSLDEVENVNGYPPSKLPREGRIALARNLALRELRNLPRTDYVITVDMDIVGWDPLGLQDSFGRKESWDVACAHGILLHGIYRDTYALRALDLNNNHHLSGEDHAMYNISEDQWKINRAKLKVEVCETRITLQDLSTVSFYCGRQTKSYRWSLWISAAFGGIS